MVKRKIKKHVKVNPLLPVTILSVAINIVAIAVLVTGSVFEKAGTFDYATANSGINVMCSEQFRQKVEQDSKARGETGDQVKAAVALVDYPCSNNGADTFYQEGYTKYLESLGVKQ